ncbi:MAG: diguanylate cyclase domain-containing protein [Pseudomonadaceae bacterium]
MLRFLLRSSPSLRRVLLIPYVLLTLVGALVLSVSSYHAGSVAIEDVAARLLDKTVQQLSQATLHHLSDSVAVLEAAFPRDMLAPTALEQDEQELIKRFWIATSLHPAPNNYVYYGDQFGQEFGLYRRSPHEAELRVKYQADQQRSIYRLHGPLGTPERIGNEEGLSDPRIRLWYLAGENGAHHTWTSVSIDFDTLDLVATRARSVRSSDGELVGMVATDVSLRTLNTFIRELKPSPNGLALIFDTEGSLIASSSGGKLLSDSDIGTQRLHVQDDQNPLARITYAQLRQYLQDTDSDSREQTFSFRTDDGEQINAAFGTVHDGTGQEWTVLVAMPRSDFLVGLTEGTKLTAVIVITTVLIALLLGLVMVHWVVADISRLALAAKSIGKGQVDVPLRIDRQDEIGRLARAFENMHVELSTDRLTGLASRTALMRQLEFAIHRQQSNSDKTSFALLFVDLNRFKAINDTYGHDAGDLALVETAQRLREALRQGDLVARLGGDEFVIVLWRTSSSEAVRQVCDKLIALLSRPLTSLAHIASEREVSVGAAVGVAIYPHDGADADSLLKRADLNMYREKQTRDARDR